MALMRALIVAVMSLSACGFTPNGLGPGGDGGGGDGGDGGSGSASPGRWTTKLGARPVMTSRPAWSAL